MKVHDLDLKHDVIVIGGGAAGMIAAISAAERRRKVLLIEKADRNGRKILASGNGRCNLMNRGEPRYYGDPGFAGKVLANCSGDDLSAFFRRYGLFLNEEEEGRVYPLTNQSQSVLSVLKNAMTLNGVSVRMNCRAESVRRDGPVFRVTVSTGETLEACKIIVACGGAAQPKLGGSPDGYGILRSLGHTVIPTVPSLVPLNTDSRSISGLSGIRIRCTVSLACGNEVIHREEGEVLFTDYGVSGICVMQCARFIEGSDCCLLLNVLRHAFPDRDEALRELRERKQRFAACLPVWLRNPERMWARCSLSTDSTA